jgi:dynein heavy chain
MMQLNQLTSLIRTPLAPILRKTLVALITQEVHNRDITEKLYSSEQVIGKSDFQWLQQLRYYL